jgi:hypothetical protein
MTAVRIARLVAAVALAAAFMAAPASVPAQLAVPSVDASSLSRWTGRVDLYRPGTFSTQQTYLWCTAADVQIARNIVRVQTDHSRASQSRYFNWMRAHNRYDIPIRDGVDPQGWAAGMRNFVDSRYRLATFRSYTSALRSAVTSLRLTNRPVGVLVARGGHAWLMTGFSATADPAATRDFTVTSVRVVGPLYGLQSRNGYDMPPNTSLSASAFKRFFTPWHYARIRMAWEGMYGTVQATPANAAPAPLAASALHPLIPGLSRTAPSPRGTAAVPTAPAISSATTASAAPDSVAAPGGGGPGAASPAAGATDIAAPVALALILMAVVILAVVLAHRLGGSRSSRGRLRRRPGRPRRESDFA